MASPLPPFAPKLPRLKPLWTLIIRCSRRQTRQGTTSKRSKNNNVCIIKPNFHFPKEIVMMDKTVPSMLQAIGNTPLVRLNRVVPSHCADVLVKLEYYNPTGSYKDRLALSMIEEAEKRGDLRPGMTVVEYTGGSTGSSLAFVCAVKGYRFRVVSSDAFAKAKLDTMTAFGAELHIVRSKGGKVTPDLVPRMIEEASALAEQEGTYFTNQLHNSDTIEGYRKIGEELVGQLDRPIDAFCGGVGTAGMLMGVAQVVRQSHPRAKIVALEPATSAVRNVSRDLDTSKG